MSKIITDRIVTDEYEFKKILGKYPLRPHNLILSRINLNIPTFGGTGFPSQNFETLTSSIPFSLGGYSYVVLANHNATKVDYAVKIFDKKKMTNSEAVRLRRELDINFQVSHPNIVRVIEVFESNDDVCMIMQLMNGGELFDKIVKTGPLPEATAKRYAKTTLNVLQYLHGLGIVHRDLKPENLLLESSDPLSEVKLIDFGFAKFAHGKSVLTTPIGTPNYAAPEVTASDEAYTMGVDLWSMGCVLYFLLFARPPFYSENDEEVDRLVSIGKYAFPSNVAVSDEAKELISKLLVMDPRSRLTATEALHHKWFAESKVDSTVNMEEAEEPPQHLELSSEEVDSLRSSMNKPIDKTRRNSVGNPLARPGEGGALALDDANKSALWKRRQQKKAQSSTNQ